MGDEKKKEREKKRAVAVDIKCKKKKEKKKRGYPYSFLFFPLSEKTRDLENKTKRKIKSGTQQVDESRRDSRTI